MSRAFLRAPKRPGYMRGPGTRGRFCASRGRAGGVAFKVWMIEDGIPEVLSTTGSGT